MRFSRPIMLAMMCAAIQPALGHAAAPEIVECPAQYLVDVIERNSNGYQLNSTQFLALSGATMSHSSGEEIEVTMSIQTVYDKAGKPQKPVVTKDRILIGTSVSLRVERSGDANDHVWARIDKTTLSDHHQFVGGPLNDASLPSFTSQTAERRAPLTSGAGSAEIRLGEESITITVRPAAARRSEARCFKAALASNL